MMHYSKIRASKTLLTLSFTALLSACSQSHSGGTHDEGDNHHGDEKSANHGHSDEDSHRDNGDHHDSAAGVAGVAAEVTRTIDVDMADSMTFTPSAIDVQAGETIRFNVKNSGQLLHEMVLGTNDEIVEHHELMKRFPGMEHEDDNSVSLESGETGEIIWKFTKAGTFDIACLQPGHYEAGMKGNVVVSTQ